jgi:preprotein translocase subunit SecE
VFLGHKKARFDGHFSGELGVENRIRRPYVRLPSARRASQVVRVPISYEPLMAERTSPFQFLQQVRAEATKIVWPSRRETGISTVMVLAMAVLASIFFLLVDQVISMGVTTLLGLGGG